MRGGRAEGEMGKVGWMGKGGGVEEERYRNHDAVLVAKTHQLSSGPPLNYVVPHLHCLEPPLNYLGQPLNYLGTPLNYEGGKTEITRHIDNDG